MDIQLIHVYGFISFIYDVTQIDSPVVFIERADHSIILLLQHHRIRNVLMVSYETDAVLVAPVPDPSAAHIDLPPHGMKPRILHLGPLVGADPLHGVVNHGVISGVYSPEPYIIALLRRRFPFKPQKLQHGSVGIHPGRLALIQLNCPQTGLGPLQKLLNFFYIFKMIRHRITPLSSLSGALSSFVF